MANFWIVVKEVIRDADVLLIVLDARLVFDSCNSELENKIKNSEKPYIYVITKSDLVKNKNDIEKFKSILSPCVFVSSKDYHGINLLRERILIEAKKNKITLPVKVGVFGYPNIGKSSLINAVSGRGAASTSSSSGHTKGMQFVKSDNSIMFLDTPGVIPFLEKKGSKHAIIGSVDASKCKDPDLAVMELMEMFPGRIEKYYGVEEQEDLEECLEEIAKKKNFLRKGNVPDVDRVSRLILKDWHKGSIE